MITFLGAVGLMIGLICACVWVTSLVTWDCESSCDETHCKTCPFPCEKRKSK